MSLSPVSFWLVVPAAGSGKRFGEREGLKQYRPLLGIPVLQRTLDIFLSIDGLKGACVALHPDDDPVGNALEQLSGQVSEDEWIMVHDAARPCVDRADVENFLRAMSASEHGGVMAVPVSDTLKSADESKNIVATVSRYHLWQAQTPQLFRFGVLKKALREARQAALSITDEASAVERLGFRPQLYPGKHSNLKITRPDDWLLAEAVLRRSSVSTSRIGYGYDVHRFGDANTNGSVVLGGVRIPHTRSLLAHSDGDVLVHALCDALLGAAGLGDIGKHFPDTDRQYEKIDSRVLLRHVTGLLVAEGYSVANVDVTVVAQAPKVLPHVEQMRRHLAADLAVDTDRINIKATTTERLGFEGREEGMSCHAVAMIQRV